MNNKPIYVSVASICQRQSNLSDIKHFKGNKY